jgi:hypothetical protein
MIEARYSRGFYAGWQPLLTSLSNRVPWALADVLIAVAAVGCVWLLARSWRGPAAGRRLRTALRAGGVLATCAAVLATWFLLSWGLNYRRLPLSAQLDHDPARIDVARVRELATLAVGELNALHAPAHARPWPDDERLRQEMTGPFTEALRRVGLPDAIVAGRSKRTLLGAYLEAAGIAGFTNPFALDVVIVPAALPVERPALLLHEWAHLAGLAHEADAGFLGWLAGMQGHEQLRYSAWLDVLPRLAGALPEGERRAVMSGLGEGPRADYRAIAARLARVRPAVRDVAWSGYGRFLEANRVAEGLRSYDGVVGLVAGTAFDEGWRPRRRRP